MLLMAAVGLVFAPLAPLVSLAACIVFWMNSFVYKYQLMFVFISKVESGGVCPFLFLRKRVTDVHQRLWNVVINRLLFCVVLMQSLLVLSKTLLIWLSLSLTIT